METKEIRVAALAHEALGLSRVKVIFRKGGRSNPRREIGSNENNEKAYWMTHETYWSLPLEIETTIEDYMKFGAVVEAEDTDIYSLK